MKQKTRLIVWIVTVFIGLMTFATGVYIVDPYLHYHKPLTDKLFYRLDNERSQNPGIYEHFDYDAIVTGTSMIENFRTSEVDELFGVQSIKVSFPGGTYKEINDHLEKALEANPKVKKIIRGIDISYYTNDSQKMRTDMGEYPTYLYDDNPFNDVRYIFNKDIIFGRVFKMVFQDKKDGITPGITSFDEYSRWQESDQFIFGINSVLPEEFSNIKAKNQQGLTSEERNTIKENISINLTSLADKNPDVEFIYFLTPYSAAWWNSINEDGTLNKQIEAEEYVIELVLKHPNIKLYSFNNLLSLTTDLNNYKDTVHYGAWVNSFILNEMKRDEFLISQDNYKGYINSLRNNYTSIDYTTLNNQTDYENDLEAGIKMYQTYSNMDPLDLLSDKASHLEISNASLESLSDNGKQGIVTKGRLDRGSNDDTELWDYLLKEEYIGFKCYVDSINSYKYLSFSGRKISNHGQPTVFIFDEEGKRIAEIRSTYRSIDNDWHKYIVDVSNLKGSVTIIFNGGYIDDTGNPNSSFAFSDVTLY